MADLTRNGVTFTEAYLEAASISPVDRAMLDMLELYHPLVGSIYLVNSRTNWEVLHEDSSDSITYLACGMRIRPAEESDSAQTPETQIVLSNISVVVSDYLRQTKASLTPWVAIARKYASDDLSGPAQLPPTRMELTGVTVGKSSATLSLSFGDAGNVGFPALTFNRDDYPTLQR